MLWRRRIALALVFAVAGCTVNAGVGEETKELAVAFARALSARAYDRAYSMTSSEYQERVSQEEMRAAFEAIVPPDWGQTEPIEVGLSLSDWPDRQGGDIGWVYVGISGDVYSEGLAVVVARTGNRQEIREVEWGRP